jgi:hypothetical protein
VGH